MADFEGPADRSTCLKVNTSWPPGHAVVQLALRVSSFNAICEEHLCAPKIQIFLKVAMLQRSIPLCEVTSHCDADLHVACLQVLLVKARALEQYI